MQHSEGAALSHRRRRKTRPDAGDGPRMAPTTAPGLQIALTIVLSLPLLQIGPSSGQQTGLSFPGVARELASFCSARPSLSIDLAPMIVHVKKNTSFNYKLYLFSQDQHVFQTGQIVPRDDFRIHSFPVKLKHLNEFLPLLSKSGSADGAGEQQSVEVYRLVPINERNQNQGRRSRLVRVSSGSFDARRFFARVPLVLDTVSEPPARRAHRSQSTDDQAESATQTEGRALPFDVQGDLLPGDHHNRHDAALAPELRASSNVNEHIEFDRDDQLAILGQPSQRLRELNQRRPQRPHSPTDPNQQAEAESHRHHQTMVMPVGSFSSFRVNVAYLARKDFGQQEPEVVRLKVDARRFQVSRVDLLMPAVDDEQQSGGELNATSEMDAGDLPESEDFAFLSHKLLRDKNVRLTSISQIYEDWITRNLYTIVYIQRRLDQPAMAENADEDTDSLRARAGSGARRQPVEPAGEVVSERLVFRGSSIVLLGADQLNYPVKASAFITEKNGLHYYLEFLANGKFHLGAIDWTKRPFKFIDSQRFPIKPTRTQFDNEELLLCPPAVCYADQPVDELVAYGRLPLADKLQREASILSKSSSNSPSSSSAPQPTNESQVLTLADAASAVGNQTATISHQSEPISLDALIEAMRAGAAKLDVRLHLRDWTWQVAAQPQRPNTRFVWRYEWARRNELKVTRDTYGFGLAGHEIDASYRVFNELYLISANHLIAINYTLANETVTSVHPIGEEFTGLSSNLLDPITGAFYDRYSNQIYFFKGDRYVGYDYATKRPLEDFLLPPAVDDSLGGLSLALLMQPAAAGPSNKLEARPQQQVEGLVSSLPVVGILGEQHQVDAIYHDLGDDLVYVFAGMKFYTHKASDFKDGAFRAASGEKLELNWRCANEHLLAGCRFDAAYPNPCSSSNGDNVATSPGFDVEGNDVKAADRKKPTDRLRSQQAAGEEQADQNGGREREGNGAGSFSEEQQKKLRSIAARGGLMDFLLENTLVAHGAARAFGQPNGSSSQTRESSGRHAHGSEPEQIVVYLLIAMVLVTVLVTVAMIMVVLNWARLRAPGPRQAGGDTHKMTPAQRTKSALADEHQQHQRFGQSLGNVHGQLLAERVAYPPAISQYLSNQYQQQGPTSGPLYYGPPVSNPAASRRLAGYRPAAASPLTSPPNIAPPPAPRRSDYSQTDASLGRSELVDSSMF